MAAALLLLSCAGSGGRREPGSLGSPAPAASVLAPAGGALVAVSPPGSSASRDDLGPVPLHPDDARLGAPGAPVTLVAVTDLQCPFCARADATLQQLQHKYGPELRVVLKHLPLDFHPQARAAALAALRVQREQGDAAAFRFVTTVLEGQQALSTDNLALWASRVRGSGAERRAFSSTPEEQLRRDIDWAAAHGVHGTPHFLVNGKRVAGAQPFEHFVAVIDAELDAIALARSRGEPVAYADRAAVNYQAPENPVAHAEPDEGRIWNVPIGDSPVWGPPDALVTIVEFSDYQCPFCRRVQGTLEALLQKYGGDLRIVFKHNPLPFHDRAGPAAAFAVAVHRERGNTAFWQATRSLFGAPPEALSDAALESLGKTLGLNPDKVRTALKRGATDPAVAADAALAVGLDALGTPAFFINGQKLVGAQPRPVFEAAIDAQLEATRAMVKAGVARKDVYDRIMSLAERQR